VDFRKLGVVVFILVPVFSSLLIAQATKPFMVAGLRPSKDLVWKRTSPNAKQPDGPVLYQIIFRSSATPNHVPVISPTFTLMNSPISVVGGNVVISGMSINGGTGVISFAGGQTFPGIGTITGVTAGDGLTGGGVSGTVGLAVDGTVARTNASNNFLADQTITGNLTIANPGNITLANGSVFSGIDVDASNKMGVGTFTPSFDLSLGGDAARTIAMERTTTGAGNILTVQAGTAALGSTNLRGGDVVLSAGNGTGLGASGNVRFQTAGQNDLSGTSDNLLTDRIIIVSRAKGLTLSAPGFTSLMSIHLTGTHTAGGRIRYMVRATDGGSQIATEEGIIQYLATANSITCTVQTNDKLHLGTVNSGCTPGFFNPGSQPGVSIFDNVSFSSPAAIVVHEVYFSIENESGSSIRLEP
jgi:hypothetical protein